MSKLLNFLMTHWEGLAGTVGAIVAFFVGLRTKKYQTKTVQSDALASMQKTYDTFVEDFNTKYEEMKLELESKIEDLEQKWRTRYNQLKTAFDNYKRNHQ